MNVRLSGQHRLVNRGGAVGCMLAIAFNGDIATLFHPISASVAPVAMMTVAAPAASQTMIDQLIGRMTRKQSVASGTFNPRRELASINPAQTAEINRLLSLPIQDVKITTDRQQALPLIRRIVATGSCARHELAWNAFNRETLILRNQSPTAAWRASRP